MTSPSARPSPRQVCRRAHRSRPVGPMSRPSTDGIPPPAPHLTRLPTEGTDMRQAVPTAGYSRRAPFGQAARLLLTFFVTIALSGCSALAAIAQDSESAPPAANHTMKFDGRHAARLEPGQPSGRHSGRGVLGDASHHPRAPPEHQGAGLQERPDPGDLEQPPVRHGAVHHRRRLPGVRQGGDGLGDRRGPVRRDAPSPRLLAVDLGDVTGPRRCPRPLRLHLEADHRHLP